MCEINEIYFIYILVFLNMRVRFKKPIDDQKEPILESKKFNTSI